MCLDLREKYFETLNGIVESAKADKYYDLGDAHDYVMRIKGAYEFAKACGIQNTGLDSETKVSVFKIGLVFHKPEHWLDEAFRTGHGVLDD